jgi:hypothetical protein
LFIGLLLPAVSAPVNAVKMFFDGSTVEGINLLHGATDEVPSGFFVGCLVLSR